MLFNEYLRDINGYNLFILVENYQIRVLLNVMKKKDDVFKENCQFFMFYLDKM